MFSHLYTKLNTKAFETFLVVFDRNSSGTELSSNSSFADSCHSLETAVICHTHNTRYYWDGNAGESALGDEGIVDIAVKEHLSNNAISPSIDF